MKQRRFGHTPFRVSVLGLGAIQVGEEHVEDAAAGRFLNAALDLGITLIDTARGYKLSEERIGRHVGHRRDEFVLSSKCGYGIEGVKDWTARCITRGVDEALKRLRTDRIDIMHLHSCPLATLRRGAVIEALARAVEAGKVGVAAYSGEEEARAYALSCGAFGSIQTSINICDQRVLAADLPRARADKLGVIGKRPMANAFWRFKRRPRGEYCEPYWERARAMELSPGKLPWDEFALRFGAHQPGVHSVIAGSADLRHLKRNIALIEKGPLPRAVVSEVRRLFREHDDGWVGQV